MRLFLGLALIIGGIGLCLFDNFTIALTNSKSTAFYREQLQSLPVQQTYTRTELADAAWQVWTNRGALPHQDAYSAADLKVALIIPLVGSNQASCSRSLFEFAIGKVAGYQPNAERKTTFLGLLCMLGGAFLLGAVFFPDADKTRT